MKRAGSNAALSRRSWDALGRTLNIDKLVYCIKMVSPGYEVEEIKYLVHSPERCNLFMTLFVRVFKDLSPQATTSSGDNGLKD